MAQCICNALFPVSAMGSTTTQRANHGPLLSPAWPPPSQLRSHVGSTNAGTQTACANGGSPVPCRWVFSKVSRSILCMKNATSQFAPAGPSLPLPFPTGTVGPLRRTPAGPSKPGRLKFPSRAPERPAMEELSHQAHRRRQTDSYPGPKITLHSRAERRGSALSLSQRLLHDRRS